MSHLQRTGSIRGCAAPAPMARATDGMPVHAVMPGAMPTSRPNESAWHSAGTSSARSRADALYRA
ncbi:hypothetical protein [Streptomyces sp. NPDC089795]|uniref:hypothetical protein n=1 Tax=Streptomyces sp. NPDC089795 TaxID=3155297 RepID=UPI00342026D8